MLSKCLGRIFFDFPKSSFVQHNFPIMIQKDGVGTFIVSFEPMGAYRHASHLFPNASLWISKVDGFVWITKEPNAVNESDELYVSYVRWTSRNGRHRIRLTYWAKTNVQIFNPGAIHIHWTEPSALDTAKLPRVCPDAPVKRVGPMHGSKSSHCTRRLDFDHVE